jgi:glycosyltransferase involved in cell wall biosynthesis
MLMKNGAVGKFDLVMLTKNSAKLLPVVLRRIDQVIPKRVIGKKIVIDDHSIENTVEIAEKFGWTVHPNQGSGLFDAFDTALSYVSTDFFISFEHDIILAKDWWTKISKYTQDDTMAVVQGVRVYTHPVLRKLSEFMINRKDYGFTNFSMDNNIYRTKLLRKFKIHIYSGYLDTAHFLRKNGFKWVSDINVVSGHISSHYDIFSYMTTRCTI